MKLELSDKYLDFLEYDAEREFLEGTTFAGKTTVGVPKFMFKVAQSDKKLHVLSGLDLGTIEKNIINKDLGILDIFGGLVEYNSSGKGDHSLPHIVFKPNGNNEDIKIIYVVGYDNKTRWKKVLGGQYGCVMIDEINVADMDYVREIIMRCDYMIATLNPDDPNLPIYKEVINHARPIDKYKDDVPGQIMKELMKNEPKKDWIHWFFSFKDNASLTNEKRDQIIGSVAPGTKQYKNKIQGLRGRHTGLVFSAFDEEKNVVSREWLKMRIQSSYTNEDKIRFKRFIAGVDTSYSRKSDDTIAFKFEGITEDGRLIKLATETHNNTERAAKGLTTFAPSDVALMLMRFLNKWSDNYGLPTVVFIDSADQATITEVEKYKRKYGCLYTFAPSYKKLKIIDRVSLENGWYAQRSILIVREDNEQHINELNVYSWKDDKQEPEDSNDHTINASQYAWIPYKHEIREAIIE